MLRWIFPISEIGKKLFRGHPKGFRQCSFDPRLPAYPFANLADSTVRHAEFARDIHQGRTGDPQFRFHALMRIQLRFGWPPHAGIMERRFSEGNAQEITAETAVGSNS